MQVRLYEVSTSNPVQVWFANLDSKNCVGINCVLWDFDNYSTSFTEMFYVNGAINNDAENDDDLWPPQINNLTPYTNYTVQVSLISLNQTYVHTESHSFSIFGDLDDDGVEDINDNCPTEPNPQQLDIDSDGIGDVCDSDKDGDGILDTSDNCLLVNQKANLDDDAKEMHVMQISMVIMSQMWLHFMSRMVQVRIYVRMSMQQERMKIWMDVLTKLNLLNVKSVKVQVKEMKQTHCLTQGIWGLLMVGDGMCLGWLAYAALKALNLIRFERTSSNDLAHMPKRKTADLYSDHYSQRGIVRQQEMTLSARMDLDDYVTEENE